MNRASAASENADETKRSGTTRLWVWGSILVTCGLWAYAAFCPSLGKLLAGTDGKGQIGDFLGGVSAPILGIAGMILVYRSFQAQVEANRLQHEALRKERDARERDEAGKFIEDGLHRLERILERTCYARRSGPGVYQMHYGQDGIYRFCVDCSRDQGLVAYWENEIILDAVHHWFFQARLFLRTAADFEPDMRAQMVFDLERLYAFTLAKSLNTLFKPGYREGEFKMAVEYLQAERDRFLRALEGRFDEHSA